MQNEYILHRCRFLPFQPSGVVSIAVTPDIYPNPLVAVVRMDHSIEIWNTTLLPTSFNVPFSNSAFCHENDSFSSWHCQLKIYPPSQIESVAWSVRQTDKEMIPRLFVGSLDGDLIEYDLKTCKPIFAVTSNGGGSIWSITVSPCQFYLYTGCEDGCVRLFDLLDVDGVPQLDYKKAYDRQKGRILCVALGQDSTLYTGGGDGLIRKWDSKTGKCVGRMRVGTSVSEEALVWTVIPLSGGTVASGDSLGTVRIWDSRTETLLHSFHAHAADVLCMASNSSKTALFSSGLDTKIVLFQKLDNGDWIQSQHRRFHTHDVTSLCWIQNFPKTLKRGLNESGRHPIFDCLVAGSADTFLSVLPCPLENFSKFTHPGRQSPFPHNSVVSIFKNSRLLSTFQDNCISIYYLAKSQHDKLDLATGSEFRSYVCNNSKYLAKIKIPKNSKILFTAICDNELCVGDSEVTRLYDLHQGPNGMLKISKRETLPFVSKMGIFSENFLFLATFDSIVSVDRSTLEIKKISTMYNITSIAVSKNGRYVAFVNSNNDCVLYNVETLEKTEIPLPGSSICTSLSFIKLLNGVHVAVSLASQSFPYSSIIFYNIEEPQDHTLTEAIAAVGWLAKKKEKITKILCVDGIIYVISQKYVGKFRVKLLLKDFKKFLNSADGVESHSFQKNWSYTHKFENIMDFGLVGDNYDEFYIFEKPWNAVREKLGDVFDDKRYGM